jgi:hypothetical protein
MKTNLFNARRHAHSGPGGWFCTCCGPAPKHRAVVARMHKRKVYRLLDRLEAETEPQNKGNT